MKWLICILVLLWTMSCTVQEKEELSSASSVPIIVGDGSGIAEPGADATLTWEVNSEQAQTAFVEASYDGGLTWTIVEENVINVGSYTFSVPDVPGATFRIRLRGSDGKEVIAESKEISITGSTPVLISSDNQTDYKSGSTIDLSWTTNSDHPAEVAMQWSSDGGLTFQSEQTGITNSGQFSYQVAEGYSGPLILRIIDPLTKLVLAQSPAFNIELQTPGISGFTISSGGGISTSESYSMVMVLGEPMASQLSTNASGDIAVRPGLIGLTE